MTGESLNIAEDLTGRVFYRPELHVSDPWLSLDVCGARVNLTIDLTPESAQALRALADQVDAAYAEKKAAEHE